MIFLANRENNFTHNLGVKLLAAVEFPMEVSIKNYINKCSLPVIIGLARSDNIDMKWFPSEDNENNVINDETLKGKINDILSVIKTVIGDKAHDPCSLWLFGESSTNTST